MKSAILILTLLFSASSVVFKEQITTFYHTQIEAYSVAQVVTDLRDFENLPAFSISGLTLEGDSFYDFRAFPLKDTRSGQKIFIVPKGATLPNANVIQIFKVKFKRQFKSSFLGVNVIILEEI
jgi:hypothetical protein